MFAFSFRRICLSVLALLGGSMAKAQEFPLYDNGLIYSTEAVSKLKTHVKEAELKYRVCDPNHRYYAEWQSAGNLYVLYDPDKKKLEALEAKLKVGISEGEFTKPVVNELIRNEILAFIFIPQYRALNAAYAREAYGNVPLCLESEAGKTSLFAIINTLGADGQKTSFENNGVRADKMPPGHILYDLDTNYADPGGYKLEVLFVHKPFQSHALPARYSRMVTYSTCLVDTNEQVMLSDNYYYPYRGKKEKKLKAVNRFLAVAPGLPGRDNQQSRDSLKAVFADQPKLQKALDAAYAELIAGNQGHPQVEQYVHACMSAQKALDLKRRRNVVGFCSMDAGPRIHATEIALLAGESGYWPIFLRSHLNIMNDRFARMSDGSYAQPERQTYLRELEELDINTNDLLLGISLWVSNPAKNHYFGSIHRLGRAFAESRTRDTFENKVLGMLRDPELDALNRYRLFYLYYNYLGYLDDKEYAKQRMESLKKESARLPAFLRGLVAEMKLEE